MNPHNRENHPSIRPEELTAFVDGLLSQRDTQRVEEWLKGNPEAAADLAGQRNVLNLSADLPIPEPSEAAWRRVQREVEAAVARPTPWRGGRATWGPWSIVASGCVAASLLAAFVFLEPGKQAALPTVFAVAEERDVEIQSVQQSDLDHVLVGRLPMEDPMVFVSSGDVRVEELQEDTDGMRPEVLLDERPAIPMIMVPMNSPR